MIYLGKKIQAPIFIAMDDADAVRYELALEVFRANGDGKMGNLHGLPKSRLAILPGTTHMPMTDFKRGCATGPSVIKGGAGKGKLHLNNYVLTSPTFTW